MSKKKNSRAELYRLAGIGFSLGLEVALASFGGWWVGDKLDQHFDSAPYGGLIGAFLLAGISIVHMLRILKRITGGS